MQILIVEDEPKTRNGLKKLVLTFQPTAQVETAENGKEALEICERQFFDLIFTDICMPNMDGLEFLEQLEKRGRQLVVISGYADFSYAQKAMKHGVQDYLLKPVNPMKIKEVLKNASMRYRIQQGSALRTLLNEREYISDKLKEQLWKKLSLKPIAVIAGIFMEDSVQWDVQIQNCKNIVYAVQKELMDEVSTICFCRKNMLVLCVSANTARQCEDYFERLNPQIPFAQIRQSAPLTEEQGLWLGYDEVLQKEKDELQNLQDTANPIKLIKAYIQEHLSENLTLNEMAELAYVHPTYLSKLFKKETGQNISDYILDCRIQTAKEYLKKPQYKIYEVAEICGFKDPKYFSNVFKGAVGCTPKEYRNS